MCALSPHAHGQVGSCTLLWHKTCSYIPLTATQPMGVGRPMYSQLVAVTSFRYDSCPNQSCCYPCALQVCYGKQDASGDRSCSYDAAAALSPDVFDRGRVLWARGMGLQVV